MFCSGGFGLPEAEALYCLSLAAFFIMDWKEMPVTVGTFPKSEGAFKKVYGILEWKAAWPSIDAVDV